ncbi:cadherin-like and PC-esterase domain-containing protein 1, partial [Centroberyx affinis]|uniref:cadherin-like and PC-esterase domain-containing protein 1 n=1 Tax=Centroberyx affinis TaxID=166261 RepID=UPI003A5B9DC8
VRGAGQKGAGRRQAVVLTGRHVATDTEVQLYQRVLEQTGHEVRLSRYAETSAALRPRGGASEWSILVCLSGSEKSCLRRVSFSRLQPHQRVNMVPWLVEAFSDAGGGLCQFYKDRRLSGFALPMKPYACGSTNEKLRVLQDSAEHDRHSVNPSIPAGLVATVNVYVLVTSASPLTAFLHGSSIIRSGEELNGQTTQLKTFLLQQLGSTASHEALGHVKEVVGQVLVAAVLTNQEADSLHRCLLCYQLLTFTLHFTGSLIPVVVKLDTDLRFTGLRDPAFDGQITKELILEDTLRFLLPPHSGLAGLKMSSNAETTRREKYGGCKGTHGLCLPEDELFLLLQFQRQMKTNGAFELLYPSASSEHWPFQRLLSQGFSTADGPTNVSHLPALLLRLSLYHQLQRNHTFRTDQTEAQTNQESGLASQDLLEGREHCVDPHLRQIYTDPPLTLTPAFSPWVKEYRAEVPFDIVTVRIRPEPVSSACRIHLDEHRGPRTANYPVGLGNSRISILVADEAVPEPVVMTIYTLHMYRESRPSLPMFGDHVMCGFVQDCGLIVQPGQPCGLEPFPGSKTLSKATPQPCTSGDVPGRWVVPCLSCADNRTCDWREVAWQPEGCYHPLLDRSQLQDCMMDRKVLFIGDSTNRGMMYFLMERVNTSLEDWGKAHDTLIYSNLNQGHTHVSYSYYPQFWLEKSLRPTFQQALEQLLQRSRPLVNSDQTVLVAGGVQWLNTNHLRIISEVLEREGLSNIMVVVKSLGMGFHLPVDGIRSLGLRGIQDLYRENHNIIATAKQYGYEVIDTFCITMGRYKEFLQGRCACHFHEVEKLWFSKAPLYRKMKILQHSADGTASRSTRAIFTGAGAGTGTGAGLSGQSVLLDTDQWPGSNASSYHVRGPVNQVYSEILLSRLCPKHRGN